MEREIQIGSKNVKLNINALTPILYKRFFKSDMIVSLNTMRGGKSPETATEFFPQLAYCGYCQASKEKMTEEGFEKFLSGFEALDIVIAAPQIMQLVNAQREHTSTEKN